MIKFADRTAEMQASEIRESYKLMGIPGMISMASGSPNPAYYPAEAIKQAAMYIYDHMPSDAMAYASTEGYGPLRDKLVDRMWKKAGVKCTRDNISLISGSQQGLEMAAKIFVNEGDYIACETPSYMGAFNAFCPYQPRYESVPTDELGMLPEELDRILANNDRVKLIYVIPNFQNPTGHTWSLERRKAFMDVVNKYEIPVIEDDPYGELRYEGEPLPSLKSMDTRGLVIYLGSFSKILAPGFRVAWVCAEPAIIEKFVLAKQGSDMQVASNNALLINQYMEMNDLDAHVQEIIAGYRHRRDVMLKAMEENFPSCLKWNKPDGGLFIWVTLPEGIDAHDILNVCVENKVIFVTGKLFYPVNGPVNTLRLNFSKMDDEQIVEGIRRMGAAVKKALGE